MKQEAKMELPKQISEKQFFEEYEKCKVIVDCGVKDYFILKDNKTFSDIEGMENLTLLEIEDCFGEHFIYLFRFAVNLNIDGEKNPEYIQTLRFRRMINSDKKKIRGTYRFFPSDCWICEWNDATNFLHLIPFVQKEDGTVHFLAENSLFRNDKKDFKNGFDHTAPKEYIKELLEKLPWYVDCVFAIVNYNGVEAMIPIESHSAKKTFKNRDKDETGVKRHLIHNVSEHDRINLKNADSVQSHLRGCSDLTINGLKVTLMASWEWGLRALKQKGLLNK